MMDRSFILLRFTLIIATGYLLIAEFGPRSIPVALMVLLAVVAVSNLGALALPARWLRSPWLVAGTIVADTIWITAALIATGRFTPEFFYLYFFVLFLAGVGENIRLIALGVAVVCLAYVVLVARTVGLDEVMTTQTLIRVPFLFSVAIFYGYLVDRLRRERHRVTREQAIIESLEGNRRALAEANEELRRRSDVKSKFVSTVSHELKSPLTAIKNAASLIDLQGDREQNERFLQMITRNVARLQLIISDLLDMSKAESGSVAIAAAPVDLGPFLSEIVDTFGPQADAAGVALEVVVDPDLPPVTADAPRIEQVITNLISNALKATRPGGSVIVAVERSPDGDVVVGVTDTGIGLSPEDRDKVFEPFFQAETRIEGKPAGTGLGLTICRDLIRGHGSDLMLESELGRGSRFSFALAADPRLAEETIAFENQLRGTYRAHPYFSIVIVDCGTGIGAGEGGSPARARFEEVAGLLDQLLPRALDVVVPQPNHGRVIAVLLSTPLPGAWVVKRKLASIVESRFKRAKSGELAAAKILGPAGYPENGDHGAALIGRVLEVGERMEEGP